MQPLSLKRILILSAVTPCLACFASLGSPQKSPSRTAASLPAVTDPQQIFRQVGPSIFVVETLDSDGIVVALGSGVAVHPPSTVKTDSQSLIDSVDGTRQGAISTLIVTNTHVINPGVSFRVRQGSKTWPAEVEHVALHADLCRLRVNGLKTRPVELRDDDTIDIGERVYSIGAPEGLELTISEGLISGLREFDGSRVIQTTAAISHGSSGGGLFDAQGRLVGITTFTLTRGQNLNFALPIDTIGEPATSLDFDLAQNHANGALSYAEAVQIFDKQKIDHDLADIHSFEQILKKSPNDAHAHAILGDRVLMLDPHRAIRELNEALRLNADDEESYYDLGVALRKVGDPYGAIVELRRFVELKPADEIAHSTLLDALLDDETPTALVLGEARVVARLNPKNVMFLLPVAKWMVENGDKDSGMEVCKEILNGDSVKAFGPYCVGIVQWLGDPPDKERAVSQFRKAAILWDGFGDFHHSLAIALELTGRYAEALQEYKRANEISPNEPTIKADYESALKELKTEAVPEHPAPNLDNSTDRRRRLEKEVGCDRILLRCRNPGN